MKTPLLCLLLFLSLHCSFAQNSLYKEKFVIGSVPAMNIANMTIDKEDNLYLTDMSKVVKVKDGKVLLEFNVNKNDYSAGYNNSEGVYLDVAVDQQQFIYILNRKKKRIEKHDQHGQLLKVFEPAGDISKDVYRSLSLHLDKDDNLNVFDDYNRRVFVYDTEGNLLKTITLEDPDPIWDSDNASIAFDNQNNIYIAETKKYSWNPTFHISLFNRDGKIIRRYSEDVLEEHGLIKSQYMNIEVNNNGDLYIYNSRSPVRVFSPIGSFKKSFYVKTLNFYDLNNAGGIIIRFDSQNYMYAGATNNYGDTIFKYDQEQNFIEQLGNLRRPHEVAYDKSGNYYILDHFTYEIVKYNAAGKEVMVFGGEDTYNYNPLTLTVDDEGYIYLLEYTNSSGYQNTKIKKFDSSGNLITTLDNIEGSYGAGYLHYTSAGLAVDSEGNIYVTSFNNYNTPSLIKYNSQGSLIARFGPPGTAPGQLSRPLDVTVDAVGNVFVLDMNGNRVQKFSSSGKFIQQYGSFDANEDSHPIRASIASDAFGNVIVATPIGTHMGIKGSNVKYYDLTGNLIFSLPIDAPSVAINRDGSLFATTDRHDDIVTVYEATSSREYNLIEGKIYHDANADCTQDGIENGLSDILVKAEPGLYYGATDSLGSYKLVVGKGSYTVEPLFENNSGKVISQTCVSGEITDAISFESFGNYSTGNNIGTSVTFSPYLTASVSSDRRRRCFPSTTKVSYANSGFATATNAKVYLQLPDYVVLKSADKPYTRQNDGTYIFEVGDLSAGQQQVITIQDSVVCGDESIRGLTVCTKAWITPSNHHTNIPYAETEVTGACNYENGKVRFVIRNKGESEMEAHESFRVYTDGKLAMVEQYKLASGDSLVLWIPALGKTVRLEADQPDGHPTSTLASATVEACRTEATRTFSTGLFTAMPSDDETPEISVDCQQIVDSFDPNDKLVTPTGLTEENYTPTNTALHYKIRFQNTGTDVAYRVVVVDTLSEHLDFSTLQVESASHAYVFHVSGKGRPVLTWTFNNIMLPDSTTNEPDSHGYIQFSIKPKADLLEKTAVENFADIFFDYNSPVRTNITVNRIYDMPPVIEEQNRLVPEEVISSPAITGFTPAAGRSGSVVKILGRNFSTVQEENQIWFNGTVASVTYATATALHVVVPEKATTGKLKVQTKDGAAQSSGTYTVYQPPLISAFNPAEGVVGTEVTLQGDYLAEGELESIHLGGVVCEVVSASQQALVVRVPSDALTGNFHIQTKGGEAQSTSEFVVWHQPVISSLSKQVDKVGGVVEIMGVNFAASASRNMVLFGKAQAEVLQASATVLKVRVPEGAASGPVTVETPGGKAASAAVFEVIPAPVLTSMTPGSGSVGTVVELTGEHFLALGQQDTVFFVGAKATILSSSETSLVVRVPRGAQTGKVQIAGTGGVAHSDTDFVVEDLTPQQAISVYPNPTTGKFTIDFIRADFDVQQVEIVNPVGTKVFSHKVRQQHQLEVNLQKLSAGIYLIQLNTSRGTVTQKIHLL